jgi:hypothetical protein
MEAGSSKSFSLSVRCARSAGREVRANSSLRQKKRRLHLRTINPDAYLARADIHRFGASEINRAEK